MAEKTSWCAKVVHVSICTDTELRVTCGSPAEVRQKIVSDNQGPEDTYWTFAELLDIGCFLHDAHQFRSEVFLPYRRFILNLGWTLAHNPSRSDLVKALYLLMRSWLHLCRKDAMCIPPPSLATLADNEQLKVLRTIDKLKQQLITATTENAILEQQITGRQTPLQQELVRFQEDQKLQRLNA